MHYLIENRQPQWSVVLGNSICAKVKSLQNENDASRFHDQG